MDRATLLQNARFAGGVKRYHTWPTITQQTNAEHTWNVLRIWWMIWGAPSAEVATYLIWHDAGEIKTGDLPFPIKSRHPAIKKTFDQLEGETVRAMRGPACLSLTGVDKTRAKIADLLEMWEYGWVELNLGNRFAAPIVVDTYVAVRELIENTPLSAQDEEKIMDYIDSQELLWNKPEFEEFLPCAR